MEFEYLLDYEQRENELYYSFTKKLLQKPKSQVIDFFENRFKRVLAPLALSNGGCPYSIMPFYGTTIVNLTPTTQNNFYELHGFQISEIPEIVDFSKNTGKIQFILGSPPTSFQELNHYDLIFQELNPPMHYRVDPRVIIPPEEFQEYMTEFEVLYNIGVPEIALKKLISIFPSDFISNFLWNCGYSYSLSKYLGYNEISDIISELFLEKSKDVWGILQILDYFVLMPKLDLLNAVPNYPVEGLKKNLTISTKYLFDQEYVHEIKFPYEVGRYLINKLTYMPGDLSSCISVIDHYNQFDLNKVLNNMLEAVQKNNYDLMLMNKIELDNILENIWKGSNEIEIGKSTLKYLIPMSIAIIGSLASQIDVKLGLLAGLGLTSATKLLEQKADSLSEIIAKVGYENYLIGIYDFKKKYPRTQE